MTILELIERDERKSKIDHELKRIRIWDRRPGLSFGRRAPGLWASFLCWLLE